MPSCSACRRARRPCSPRRALRFWSSPYWRRSRPPFGPCAWTCGEGSRADHLSGRNRPALNFRLREQPVQQLLAAPFISAKPPNEPLLALVLETDHEESVRTIDRWRHDLELRDLRGIP